MEIASGERIKIYHLTLEDVMLMSKWGIHKNPLFNDYNFSAMNNDELIEWYRFKTSFKSKKYFSVYNEEDNFIGYLGIKNIRNIMKESTLGVAFDPNYMNQGYGTEAIKAFLKYYFINLNMRILFLKVAKFNKRAKRCYEKCGFVVCNEYLKIYDNQLLDLNNPYYLEEKDSFVIKNKKIYNYIYKMKVDKKIVK